MWPPNQARGKLSPEGVTTVRELLMLDQREAVCRPSTHVGRLFICAQRKVVGNISNYLRSPTQECLFAYITQDSCGSSNFSVHIPSGRISVWMKTNAQVIFIT